MKILFILILNVIVLSCYSWPQNKVNNIMKMSIYYETLCGDSRRFITKQLYPAYKTIKNYFKIEFVPYGKATSIKTPGSWEFTCQHGPVECWGNKVQACALAQNAGQDADMEFINCFLSRPASEELASGCSRKAGFSFSNIMQCVESEMGNELHAQYGAITNQRLAIVKHVPTIVFNDKYNADVDERAHENLLGTVSEILNSQYQNKYIIQTRRLSDDQNSMELRSYIEIPTRPRFYEIYDSLRNIMYGNTIHKRSNQA